MPKAKEKEAAPKAAAAKPKKAVAVTPYQFGNVKERARLQNTGSRVINYAVFFTFAALVAAALSVEHWREEAKVQMDRIESQRVLWGWVSLLDFAGSALVCWNYRRATERAIKDGDARTRFMHSTPLSHYAISIFTCLFMQFGGTTSTAALLGQNPSWAAGNHVVHAFLLAWWLTFCSPLDLWYKLMGTPILWSPLQILACISGAHAVTSWGLEKALNAEHPNMRKSAYAALACGYMSGCFGWAVVAYFETCGERLKTSGPSWGMQRSFYSVIAYYLATDPHGYLEPIKTLLKVDTASKSMGKTGVCAFILVCQFGVDIAGVDPLKLLNKATGALVPLIAPVNMDLPILKEKEE